MSLVSFVNKDDNELKIQADDVGSFSKKGRGSMMLSKFQSGEVLLFLSFNAFWHRCAFAVPSFLGYFENLKIEAVRGHIFKESS